MVRFLIVRHGYSETNREQIFAGHLDAELDEIGKRQAEQLRDYLVSNYKIDRIYSSDLKRAKDTARPTAEAIGIKIETDPGIRELDVGLWKGMKVSEVAEKYPETFNLYKTNVGAARPDGGETYSELAERTNEAFIRMAEENEGKTVMVVTHGGVIRALRCLWNGYCITDAQEIAHVANASVSVVSYNNGAFSFETVGEAHYLSDGVSEKDVKQLF